MYELGSEIHVHGDYIIGHHHTLLKIIVEINTLLHHNVQNIHKVISLSHNQGVERNIVR
jgi:monoamine oxidase